MLTEVIHDFNNITRPHFLLPIQEYIVDLDLSYPIVTMANLIGIRYVISLLGMKSE